MYFDYSEADSLPIDFAISRLLCSVQLHTPVTRLRWLHADEQFSQFLPGPVQGVISTGTRPDVIHPHITLAENSVSR